MSGKLIVIEGLDGSGKATQSRLLYEELQKRGLQVGKLSFPDYDSPSSGPVRMYLNGEFGDDPDDVDCYSTSVLFAVDRFCSYRSSWKKQYDEGTVFVCDRYTTSNEVFQISKLPSDEWDRYIKWLECLVSLSRIVSCFSTCPKSVRLVCLRRGTGEMRAGKIFMKKMKNSRRGAERLPCIVLTSWDGLRSSVISTGTF